MESNEENKTNESETKEAEKPEDAVSDPPKGDNPEAPGLIAKASDAAERLEEANKKTEELITRREKLDAEAALSGRTDAGAVPPTPKEDTPEEYAEKVRSGEANPLKDDGLI